MKSWLIPINKLQISDRAAMYTLLQSHFKGITWQRFETDLQSKNWVLLLKDEISQALKGFSTMMLSQTSYLGEQLSIIYSGDTIVDPSAWSSTTLPRAWIAAVNFLRQQYPANKLYWLLICSGFRTYRFLPTFWQEFYPRYDKEIPDHLANLMAYLAQEYYGQLYHKETGIVRFQYPQILQDHLIEIPSGRYVNPHIQFFVAKNPGYHLGDELVCLTEIKYDNLTNAGQRMWKAQSALEFVDSGVQLDEIHRLFILGNGE